MRLITDLEPTFEQALTEANIASKIKDPQKIKLLRLAVLHDSTFPKHKIAALGPTAFRQDQDPKKQAENDQQILQLWSDTIDRLLSNTEFGDLSADGKFDDWLFNLYIKGAADYEDISGEAVNALGIWKVLSRRGKLKPIDQDFNKFKSIKTLQRIRNDRDYRRELDRIKDSERIEALKRDAKQTVLIDDNRFYVIVPLNFGSCYVTDRGQGYTPNFCTSSSNGHEWFQRYAPDGIIVNVTDKQNIDAEDGKWQMHAATNQIVRGDQERRHDVSYNDQRFADLFPGLMKRILAALASKADEIKQGSVNLTRSGEGYDVQANIDMMKRKFPASFASEAPAEEEEDTGPGTYLITHTTSGRTARITAESKQDAIDKLLARHPDVNLEEFTIKKQKEEPTDEDLIQ